MAEVEWHTGFSVEERGINASAVLSGWISYFTRTLYGTRSLQTFSERADTHGVTGDTGHSSGDYAAIFAWTDGQMAACFERLKFSATS